MGPSTTFSFPFLLTLCMLSLPGSVLAGQLCGNVGTHNYTTTTFYMGNFFYKAPSTFALCADFCKSDYPRCKSLRYSYYEDADAQYCEFFGDWLENFFIQDSTQPYYYYDVDCGFPTWAITETYISSTTVSVGSATQTLTQTELITQTLTRVGTTTEVSTLYATATATATATRVSTAVRTVASLSTVTTTARITLSSLRTSTLTLTQTRTQDAVKVYSTATTTATATTTVPPRTVTKTLSVGRDGSKTVTVTVGRVTSTRTVSRTR
ncbi:hypothetical protein P280DRAFT_512238 [Massarina eburnea CBS 473.64]|uniref:Apple domain-containing protein n=1 Tax=Massarina eburnea CBS 473.64 TaxID=1395130 RepID=A0A6A6SFI3_9PLEO|nr:hypothetical protein P280DRAFT_512238 [Massarina eburnea CBS 473.64]